MCGVLYDVVWLNLILIRSKNREEEEEKKWVR